MHKTLFCLILFSQFVFGQQKFIPVGFSKVNIQDDFWKPKMKKVATATLDACIYQTEIKTGRIRNFEKAAKREGKHEGIYYDDSDVYKALEAMAYSLKTNPDDSMEMKAEQWIDLIAAAQLPDGYLNTYYTLTDLGKRWTDMEKHEDYCAGHLIEAAVAYFNTTGKRKLLDVAIRFANHIDSTFRLKNRPWVSGHQEIELALMKLFHTTKNDRYLKLADWFLAQRGHGHGKGVIWDQWKAPEYCQDNVPVKQQKEITGHAVRAMYLYSGAADVAAVTGDAGYLNAMKTVWNDVVHRNMYITGGIGSSGTNEGFTTDYDLPNENAYCETCASVGMVFWNHRMNFLTGESKYADILERSLFNGALDGLSLSGDRFFYGNPLASRGQHARKEWFGTACCPSNIARLVASVGDYIYGFTNNSIWINQYIGSSTKITLGKNDVDVKLKTDFPLSGQIKMEIGVLKPTTFSLQLRIPSWSGPKLVDGDLYTAESILHNEAFIVMVNDKQVTAKVKNGYAVIEREWKGTERVDIMFPMEVKLIESRPMLVQNRDRMALQRGPLVYCVEGADNGGNVWNVILTDSVVYYRERKKLMDETIVALKAELPVVVAATDGKNVTTTTKTITFIPYYTWANRGQNPMQVWLPTRIKDVKINY